MYLKVAIECKKCGCSFELRPKLFKNPDRFECPNCGQQIPESIANDLKAGITAFSRVPYQYPEQQTELFSEDGFTFMVKEFQGKDSFAAFAELDN